MTPTLQTDAPAVDFDEPVVGSKGPFYLAHDSPSRDCRLGYFCSNCGTFDCAMDPAGRIECNACGNAHKAEQWDSAYL